MPVAKSYQNFEIVRDPFMVNGRQYVVIDTGKGTKQVRWYNDIEYARLYGLETPVVEQSNTIKTHKEVLGFDKGYITIFKGDTYPYLDYFKESNARYHKLFGWYIVSTEEVPTDLPLGIEAVQLPWDLVGEDNGHLRLDSKVKEGVESILYESSPSEFVGKIGDKIEITLTVIKSISIDSNFGNSTVHTMVDENENVYVWITAAKCWQEGSVRKVRGTIKDHKVYKNVKQTILTRCKEV